MKRETVRAVDNRAVSPWFKVFGGLGPTVQAERVRRAEGSALHRLEWIVLGAAFPLVIGVAAFDGLWRWGGAWPAALLVVPTTFILMHVLAFGLRLGNPLRAFWVWSLLLGAWSGWMVARGGETPAAWVAWAWLFWLAMQVPALLVLGWRRLMGVGGVPGLVLRGVLALAVHVAMVAIWWREGWQAGLACGMAICGFWALCVFRPASQIFGPVARRVEGRGPLLTIDDGPHPQDTPLILDLLDKHGVKAVFFVVGDKVREFPELAREIVARGHELGNHTMTHPQESMWIIGPWKTWREISECQKTIEEVAGVRPRWFRAPVGHRNYFTHPVTSALGLEVMAWTRRAFDAVLGDVDGIVRRLTKDLGDGDVLLMHEATPVASQLAERVIEKCKLEES